MISKGRLPPRDGSDFPVSHLRGYCVALGDSFLWISAENTNPNVPYAKLKLALAGHESLHTLKVAAMFTRLTDAQMEGVFTTTRPTFSDVSDDLTALGWLRISDSRPREVLFGGQFGSRVNRRGAFGNHLHGDPSLLQQEHRTVGE